MDSTVDTLGAQTIGVLRDGNRQETEGFEGVVRVASGRRFHGRRIGSQIFLETNFKYIYIYINNYIHIYIYVYIYIQIYK